MKGKDRDHLLGKAQHLDICNKVAPAAISYDYPSPPLASRINFERKLAPRLMLELSLISWLR